jgi:hypothetical protein
MVGVSDRRKKDVIASKKHQFKDAEKDEFSVNADAL